MMAESSLTGAQCERNRTPGDILYEALEDLTQYDFKRFKNKLSDFFNGGRGPIPRGRLETADYVTTKNVLTDVYGKEAALDVTIDVFKLISLMGPAEALQHQVTQHVKSQKMSSNVTLEGCRVRYMDQMRNKYHVIKHHDKRLGKGLNLKKEYTSLLLIKNHRDEKERQHEITASGQKHLRIMEDRSSDKYSPTTIPALFDPDDNGIIPKTVVLQGPAGIGKTMTSQKIMLDWASGELYKDKFQFVFYISCREVNTITGNISLAGYLSSYFGRICPSDLLQSIFHTSEKILFIVDGLDELKWSSVNDTKVCDDPFQEVSKEILLKSLFKKTLLSDSSLIITTRPLSLLKLKDFAEYLRYVEILGFTGKDREEYFYNFFETRELADLAISTIKDNDMLFTMCAVPVICWIVCTVLKPLLKEGLSVIGAKTSTSIYLLYLKSLIKYHGRDSAHSINSLIKRLCALANEGILDQRILFEESDLDRHGLSMLELESVFLNENIFQRETDTCTCYSFIHLSVQEFFAALYYVLDDISVKQPYTDLKICKVKRLLEASEDRPHLKLTIQFLFGLSSEKQIQETQRTIGCPISFRGKPVLEEWLKLKSPVCYNEILSCLYETQDEEFVGKVMSHFLKITISTSLYHVKGTQENINYRALAYCLERSTKRHTVHFYGYIIGVQAWSVLSKALSKCSQLWFLKCTFPVTEDVTQAGASLFGLFGQCQIKKLFVRNCGLTSSCCVDFRSVITTNHSLTLLDLSCNALGDSGIKLLCEGLRHPDCTLQELELRSCGLTSSCCDDLRSVITTNCSLTRLELTQNVLEDSGIKILCEGLRHPACTLKYIMLWNCGLTSSCCDDLRSVITANRSLTRLDLSHNALEDSGIKLLCEGLRHPACTLQDLRLYGCGLTSSCCDDLRSVITTNRSLTRLDLDQNALGDSGIKLLCEGLRHPACTLRHLSLEHCGLTSSCCDDLRSVITTNHSLTTLDLSENAPDGPGIKLLCEGLKHPACTLQDLRLRKCGLTSSCCDDLRSVLTTNRSLTRLRLSANALRDSGIKLLCEGLRHPDSTLPELSLSICGLTSSCCDDLRSVITTNHSLTRLDLAGNKLKDSGIKLLCEGLKHPACALQDLTLWSCDLTSSCCDDLRSVITTNRSLTGLDLRYNGLTSSGIKLQACVRPPLQLLLQ
ncbi:NACHT, LRR and PYD domains-containing protein 3-like [Pseudophryne corroboree]|uniref:NACHT, LRR and PYD domains-containing protein 3-like n=1 Tax=Pseudophryne corroboree TaxID=495146 RepID=UPI003081348F